MWDRCVDLEDSHCGRADVSFYQNVLSNKSTLTNVPAGTMEPFVVRTLSWLYHHHRLHMLFYRPTPFLLIASCVVRPSVTTLSLLSYLLPWPVSSGVIEFTVFQNIMRNM